MKIIIAIVLSVIEAAVIPVEGNYFYASLNFSQSHGKYFTNALTGSLKSEMNLAFSTELDVSPIATVDCLLCNVSNKFNFRLSSTN